MIRTDVYKIGSCFSCEVIGNPTQDVKYTEDIAFQEQKIQKLSQAKRTTKEHIGLDCLDGS